MKTAGTIVIVVMLCALVGGSVQAQFASGNVVVSVIKSAGSLPPNSSAQQRILREFRTDGTTTGQEFLLPTVVSGANRRLTNSRTVSSPTEGAVNLSADGRYLLVSGYDATLGTTNVAATPSSTTPRVVGRIEWRLSTAAGAINTSTSINDAFGQNTVRSVASHDGAGFWVTGGGTGIGGVRYVILGSTGESVNLQTSAWDLRGVAISGGQLYVSSNSPSRQGIAKIGDGLPTQADQTFALLPGFVDSTLRLHGFWFADANTLYVADERTNNSTTPVGGLQKWVYDPIVTQAWSKARTIRVVSAANGGSSVGVYAVAGTRDQQNNPLLFAISTDNRLLRLTDVGAEPTFEVMATAPENEIWRGVALLPSQGGGGGGTGTISGRITLEGCESAAVPLTFQFKTVSGSLQTQTITPTANGDFTLSSLPRTIGYLAVKSFNTLQAVQFINLALGNAQNVALTLLAGDANGDNVADISDLLLLIAHYNRALLDADYLFAADFNRDGLNDITDLILLIGNYNRVGGNLP